MGYKCRVKAFSLIVPTKNEEEVIKESIKKLLKIFENAEIVVVDESDDKTPLIVKEISKKEKRVKLLKNEIKEGLSGSILKGIKVASNEKVVVIDADLQHPPEKIKEIVEKLDDYEIVIGCGDRSIFSFKRKIVAFVAFLLANISLFLRGRKLCKDPMSGFFGLRKSVLKEIDEKKIIKSGWKILFDIIKQKDFNYEYVYFKFGLRMKGFSKLTLKEVIETLKSFIT